MAATGRILRFHYPAGKDHSLVATFDEQEWDALTRFAAEARKFAASSTYADLRVSVKIKYAHDTGLTVVGKSPDLDTVSLIVHRMRPFILEKEQTFFGKIRKILKRRLDCLPVRAMLDLLRDEFFTQAFQAQIRIIVNDCVVNAEKTFMDWLNSEEYHRLTDQKARIEALDRILPKDFLRPLLISMLVDKMRAVLNLAQFVEVIILGAETACEIVVPEEDCRQTLLLIRVSNAP